MLFSAPGYLGKIKNPFDNRKKFMNYPVEIKTIRDFIRYSLSRFNESALYYGHGTDNAWDESITLILHALHLPHDVNPLVFDASLTQAERELIFNLITTRIEKRIPVPYLTHEAWFAGLPFYVDERVLIPRSPIAELIENQFQPWVNPDEVHHILDLCTGSGCIAIACAKAFPEAHVEATDISEQALVVAKINVLRHQVEDQVDLLQSNLFKDVPKKQYNIIVTNPPYVSAEEMSELPAEYLHEPQLGLAAGTQGLDCALSILKDADSEVALQEKFPNIPFTWLEFERGGGGVFMLTKEELTKYKSQF
jgi:ribosomal protein L3 glutamine methyltransferase